MRHSFFILALLVIASCAAPAPMERRVQAQRTASVGDLQYQPITTRKFFLSSWRHIYKPAAPLTIYIEGDGFAWADRTEPSTDPTPIDPVALHLATLDPSPNVVYIARPCQFEGMRSVECNRTYWTDGRFAREVVDAYSDALSTIMNETQASRVHLVGYSGGGGIALLVAAGRSDVLDVRTIAGNIDHKTWTDMHHISPLSTSLNPADFVAKLASTPQIHFVGDSDDVMPRAVADAYRKRFINPHCVTIKTVAGVDHSKGWLEQWPNLLTTPVTCSSQ